IQCRGITRKGRKCKKSVKNFGLDGRVVYCKYHGRQKVRPELEGASILLFNHTRSECFAEWIPKYLRGETRKRLQQEMIKPSSRSDSPGYIYVLELAPDDTNFVKFKVGRSNDVGRRLREWRRQCPSTIPVLKGFFPGDLSEDGFSSMAKLTMPGPSGPLCHRLERLIHIELTDLVSNPAYLDQSWPQVDRPRVLDVVNSQRASAPCLDCGHCHQEIFRLRRWRNDKREGMEWNLIIIPLLERWGKYVEQY
ncbi:hypothetical protein CPB83DRAFT_748294, partial [Crepidotus variabilis]